MNTTAVALRGHITVTETPDGAVLLNQRTGRYWQLNATAALVLRALADGGTPERAAAALAARHPAAAGRARADVEALLTTLREADALTTRRPPTAPL
ncbi:lasso peptide biosynthesis PqqD family chaperone [Streptomyces sp. CRN 30]|uniref:lasso peptide biosynthesis PqqD family chaperone n=1 Tax=Streptomyces sp. CRN 30 TaxID=3075613 RepID=UPI002A80EAD5|nr:lasso peptide biosynthesis PqqD family chaperone [Streptomyces sp. CRN 30]